MKNRKGFTLIEIIAVLVILGILAAVAIPKYQDLQNQASAKAAEGGVAAVMSACSMQYSRALLNNSTSAAGWTCHGNLNASDVTTSGGISWNIAAGGGAGQSSITATAEGGGTATGTWNRP